MPVSRGSLRLWSWQYRTKSAAVREICWDKGGQGGISQEFRHDKTMCHWMLIHGACQYTPYILNYGNLPMTDQIIQILTYLYSLHACLQLKLIHQFLCLNNTVATAHLSWHGLQYKDSAKKNPSISGLNMLLQNQNEQQENNFVQNPKSQHRLCRSLVREAPHFSSSPVAPFIHCWGEFKGSVIWKVIQHSGGNVTNITHHFTEQPLMKRLLAKALCYMLFVFKLQCVNCCLSISLVFVI